MKMFKYIFLPERFVQPLSLLDVTRMSILRAKPAVRTDSMCILNHRPEQKSSLGLRLWNLPLQWEGIRPMKPFLFR